MKKNEKSGVRNEIKKKTTIWEWFFFLHLISESNWCKRSKRQHGKKCESFFSSFFFRDFSSLFTLLQSFFVVSLRHRSLNVHALLHFFCAGFSFHRRQTDRRNTRTTVVWTATAKVWIDYKKTIKESNETHNSPRCKQ